MTKKEKINFLRVYFEDNMPDAKTELNYNNEYELAVAVILSAQCTDKRVNMVTPLFFERFGSFEALNKGNFEEVFLLIKSISYPNNKARFLLGLAEEVVRNYEGVLPREVEVLMGLPGIGRKTANVLTSVLYGDPNMAVDTHVFRVSHRLGLVSKGAKSPLLVEEELVKLFDKSVIAKAHHWLILHGRYVCLARKPKCLVCGLGEICVYKKKGGGEV